MNLSTFKKLCVLNTSTIRQKINDFTDEYPSLSMDLIRIDIDRQFIHLNAYDLVGITLFVLVSGLYDNLFSLLSIRVTSTVVLWYLMNLIWKHVFDFPQLGNRNNDAVNYQRREPTIDNFTVRGTDLIDNDVTSRLE